MLSGVLMRIARCMVVAAVVMLGGCYHSDAPLFDPSQAIVDVVRDGDRLVHWAVVNSVDEITSECRRGLAGQQGLFCPKQREGRTQVFDVIAVGGEIMIPGLHGSSLSLHPVGHLGERPAYLVMIRESSHRYVYAAAVVDGNYILYYRPQAVSGSSGYDLAYGLISTEQARGVIRSYLSHGRPVSGVLQRVRG